MRSLLCLCLFVSLIHAEAGNNGMLLIADGVGTPCPLERTDITVSISGPIARVDLVQVFRNPLEVPAEAVYTYPLSDRGAVDRFALRAGERLIRGVVLEKQQAQERYDAAIAAGATAAILRQNRPNVFTQHIGNIPPQGSIEVRVGYTEMLRCEAGTWRFHVPTVVGPRYQSPSAQNQAPGPAAPNPNPAVITAGNAGHQLNFTLDLTSPVPHRDLHFPNYAEQATITALSPSHSRIEVRNVVPDRDLTCDWTSHAATPAAGALVHQGDDGQYLALSIEPPEWRAVMVERVPTDWVLLLDISGSMSGAPHQQALDAITALIAAMDPSTDQVQLTCFTGSASNLFEAPVPATPEHTQLVQQAAHDRKGGGGGTEMLKGFRAALSNPAKANRRRVVILLSDGYIGSEDAVHRLVAESANDNSTFIGLGIGSSVNRHLFTGIAELGNGLSRVLTPGESAATALNGLLPQITAPFLTDVHINWGTVKVDQLARALPTSIYPGAPMHCIASLTDLADGAISLNATDPNGTVLTIPVQLHSGHHPSLSSAWARDRITELGNAELRNELSRTDTDAAILEIALKHQLLSRVTSFVAVDVNQLPEELRIRMQRLDVPVNLPHGMTIPGAAKGPAEANAEMGAAGAFMAIGAGGGAGGAFGNITGGGRKRAVAKYGESKASESAVSADLRFFQRHQSPDGRWDVDAYPIQCNLPGLKCEPGTARTGIDGDILTTAEVTLCYLGSGYDHRMPNKYRKVVQAALDWLSAQQGTNGAFSTALDSHCLATQALAEAYAMTNEPRCKPIVEAAVQHLLAMKVAAGAGAAWGQEGALDVELTLQAVLALKSAKAGGLVIGTGLRDVRSWLEQATIAPADQSEALLIACFVGLRTGDAAYDRLSQAVLPQLNAQGAIADDDPKGPKLRWHSDINDTLALNLALFYHQDALPWKAWNTVFRDLLTNAQVAGKECFDGSWDPALAPEGSELRAMGRLLISARSAQALEVYYHYMPKHQGK
ncbi:MAG: VIT domain-containing protein [Planctomycetota bacterium]|jgi:Ca-activated chloride channel family protein|nr:VIT domain-containing protein [Planctomycetota bacterium]